MKHLQLYEAYGIVPVGLDPETRAQKFHDYLRVGPCAVLVVDATGVETDYLSDEDAAHTFPRLDWLCNHCKAPFSVMLKHGPSEVGTDEDGEIALLYDTEVHVAFSSAEDEARYRLEWAMQA